MTELQKILIEEYIKRMEVDHGIKENTTDRQRKNGTRSFVTPAGNVIASYRTGYVRRCNNYGSPYQINKIYKRLHKCTILKDLALETHGYMRTARQLIPDPLARLLYIVDFCKKNKELIN